MKRVIICVTNKIGLECTETNLREWDACLVSAVGAIRQLVARIANELRVPHPELMFSVSARRENRDGRPVRQA
jgi:hypothetical protein